MIWGDKSKFAIESTIESIIDGSVFGPFLVWIKGMPLGDPDDYALLKACFSWVQRTVDTSDTLINDDLYSTPLSQLTEEYSDGNWHHEWYDYNIQIWLMSGSDRYGDNLMLFRNSKGSARLVWASDRYETSDFTLEYSYLEDVLRRSVSGFAELCGAVPPKYRLQFTPNVRLKNLTFNFAGASVDAASVNIAARAEVDLKQARLLLLHKVLHWIRSNTSFKAACFLLGARSERSYLCNPDSRAEMTACSGADIICDEVERRSCALSLSFGQMLSEKLFQEPEFPAFSALLVDEIDLAKLRDLERCSCGVVVLAPTKEGLESTCQELVNKGWWIENDEYPPADEVLVAATTNGFLVLASPVTTNSSEVYTAVLGSLPVIEKLRQTPDLAASFQP